MSYYVIEGELYLMLLETDKSVIGKKIRQFRKLKNLTQFELAEKVGLNEKQISRIEMGLNYPTYTTFVKLIDVLDIDVANFIVDESTEISMYENKINNFIKVSNEAELKMYYEVMQSIKNNLNSLHSM